MINKMDMEQSNGKTGPNMKDIIKMVSNMDKVNLCGKIKVAILGNSLKMKCMGKANNVGQTGEFMKENGQKV